MPGMDIKIWTAVGKQDPVAFSPNKHLRRFKLLLGRVVLLPEIFFIGAKRAGLTKIEARELCLRKRDCRFLKSLKATKTSRLKAPRESRRGGRGGV